MAKNDKTTEELLETDDKEVLSELDELEKDPKNFEDEDETEKETEKSEDLPVESATEEEIEEKVEAEEEKEEPTKKETPELKQRYIESSREAQVLHAKNKKLNEAIDQAREIPEPTNEDMAKEFSDWEDMTDTEQKLAKKAWVNDRRFEIIHNASQEGKDVEAWNNKVDEFVDDPANIANFPILDGKEDEFKIFATKPTRRGVDFEDLVLAFKGAEAEKPVEPKKKGKLLETSTVGGDKPTVKTKMTIAEASTLRKTNYEAYKKALEQGKIEEAEF